MSYDLRIWTEKPIDNIDSYINKYCGPDWLIAVNNSEEIAKIDIDMQGFIPEKVNELLPEVKYITEINLEPSQAYYDHFNLLKEVVTKLAKENNGVIEDPQEGIFCWEY